MHKRYLVAAVVALIIATMGNVASAAFFSASPDVLDVLISEVQTRDANSSYDELLVLANNVNTPIDITNWCVKYISSTGTTKTLACFTSPDANSYYVLPVGGIAVLASTQEVEALPPGTSIDETFAGTLSNDAGAVQWFDAAGKPGDYVDWGQAATTGYADTIPIGQFIERLPATDSTYVLKETNSVADFVLAPIGNFPTSSLTLTHDLCLNLAGVQTEIPPGDSVDGQGNCSLDVDVCLNIDGMQAELPPGLMLDDAGNCLQDETTSQPSDTSGSGTSDALPSDSAGDSDPTGSDGDNSTEPPANSDDSPTDIIVAPYITELLPNPNGDDKGGEFIEVYNPNDVAIDLAHYKLKTGAMLSTNVPIPAGTMIAAGGYLALYNSTFDFTLVNTSDTASVIGGMIPDTYDTAPDGESWALIDGTWRWTNQPTPGAANIASVVSNDAKTQSSASSTAGTVVTLKPCAANQYRNPATNRCKLIASSDNSSSMPTPCAAGEERNPDTNRCRKIGATTNTPIPCKSNQERNPATNRCKNIVAMPTSTDYKVLGEKTTKDSHVYMWWIVGGVAVAGMGYAAWEWHDEIWRSAKWVWARAKRVVNK